MNNQCVQQHRWAISTTDITDLLSGVKRSSSKLALCTLLSTMPTYALEPGAAQVQTVAHQSQESVYQAEDINYKILANIEPISIIISEYGLRLNGTKFEPVKKDQCIQFLEALNTMNDPIFKTASYHIYAEYQYLNIKVNNEVKLHIRFLTQEAAAKIEEYMKAPLN